MFECADCTARFTQNVPDENNIHPYYEFPDYIPHTDTRKGLVNNLYHRVRKITLSSKKRLVEKLSGKTSAVLLDYGCGTGAFLNEMKTAGWKVMGVEPDEGARKKALQLYGIETATPQNLNSFTSASADVITLWHVLEHVHLLHETLTELKRILKDDGLLFIAVPNYTSNDAKHYGEHWAAWDVPRHLYHFSPRSLKKLFELHHLSLAASLPMWFDSFYVSMLSEKYKTGKPGLASALFTGMVSNVSALSDKDKCSSLIYVGRKVQPGLATH